MVTDQERAAGWERGHRGGLVRIQPGQRGLSAAEAQVHLGGVAEIPTHQPEAAVGTEPGIPPRRSPAPGARPGLDHLACLPSPIIAQYPGGSVTGPHPPQWYPELATSSPHASVRVPPTKRMLPLLRHQ